MKRLGVLVLGIVLGVGVSGLFNPTNQQNVLAASQSTIDSFDTITSDNSVITNSTGSYLGVNPGFIKKDGSVESKDLPNLDIAYVNGATSLTSITVEVTSLYNAGKVYTSNSPYLMNVQLLNSNNETISNKGFNPSGKGSNSNSAKQDSVTFNNVSDKVDKVKIVHNYTGTGIYGAAIKSYKVTAIPTYEALVTVNKINITPADKEIYEGQTIKLNAEVLPVEASNKEVEWSVDSTSEPIDCVTVDSTGLVTTNKPGIAIINATAKDGSNVSGSSKIIIKQDSIKSFSLKSGTPVEQKVNKEFNSSGLIFEANFEGKGITTVPNDLISFAPSVIALDTTSVTATYLGKDVIINNITVQNIIEKTITIDGDKLGLGGYGSGKKVVDNVTFSWANAMKDGTGIQLKNGSGYLQNDDNNLGEIASISIDNKTNFPKISVGSEKGKLTEYATSKNDLTTKTIPEGTKYFKIETNGKYVQMNSIEIVFLVKGAGEKTPLDELVEYLSESSPLNNTCGEKYPVANAKYIALTSNEKTTFKTSEDSKIKLARERYVAWANALNQNPWEEYSASLDVLSKMNINVLVLPTAIGLIAITTLACYFYITKKKTTK